MRESGFKGNLHGLRADLKSYRTSWFPTDLAKIIILMVGREMRRPGIRYTKCSNRVCRPKWAAAIAVC